MDQLKDKLSLLNTLIDDKKYVAADHLTIADLLFYSLKEHILDFVKTEKLDLNQFNNLKMWFDRIATEYPDFVEIASRMDGLDELVDKLKNNLNIK